MNPFVSRKGWLGQYLAACTPIAVCLMAFAYRQGGFSRGAAVALAIPMGLVAAAEGLSFWYICRSAPLSASRIGRLITTHGGAAVLSSALWVLSGVGFSGVLYWVLPDHPDLVSRYAAIAPALFGAGIVLYVLFAGLHYIVLFLDAAREAERREAKSQILAREAELSALKAQLQPHFLFNSLNSISALTSTDPSRAREMCVSLADFLRKSLAVEDRETIPIGEELSLARSYLDVERVRFGDRLDVQEEVTPGGEGALVPPLLLQPLVENAVRHGIGTLVAGGVVRIEVARAGHRLRIVVSNPFDPDASPSAGSGGLGLRLVRDRLKAAYGGEAILATKRVGAMHLAILSLPVRRAA